MQDLQDGLRWPEGGGFIQEELGRAEKKIWSILRRHQKQGTVQGIHLQKEELQFGSNAAKSVVDLDVERDRRRRDALLPLPTLKTALLTKCTFCL